MTHPHRPPIRRTLAAALAGAVAAAATVVATVAPAPSYAANPVTPGNFTGHGFDQCLAPSQKAMNTWLKHSPFLAVGIYIAGDSRGCRNQPNLTPGWVSTQLRKGWRLLPITLGPQASCHPSFPRYGNDSVINPSAGRSGNYPRARKQARYWANQTVKEARRLGIVPGSTLWYDLEGFNTGLRHCRESSLEFLSSWTRRLHALDYVSGVYSSAGSGLKALDDARVDRPGTFTMPDRIWIARWDGQANTRTSYLRNDGWLPGGRLKQYRGGHQETWGGVTINIDSNWLDLGKGSWARPRTQCAGVRVSHRNFFELSPGTKDAGRVTSLQCLLKKKGLYGGKLHGRYTPRTRRAAQRWQTSHSFPASTTWTRRHWMSLMAAGPRPVLKLGSAGEDVRRVQRSLNAAMARRSVPVSGVLNGKTEKLLRAWQSSVGHRSSGIVVPATWRAMRRGAR